MALTIDELNIQIASDSKNATRALTSLIKKLEKLKDTLNGSVASNITISNSFNKTTNSINKATTATNKNEQATKKASKSSKSWSDNLANQISKWRTLTGAFKTAANMMAEWFKESNDYIETLNLFNVTMGDAAEEARKYAESVSKAMGIDPAEWMQNQGVFKNLVSGFGVAEEASNTMSQNLTQLSYDMASFFNTKTVEEAFDKLSSAMAGQVKGLREFGIDTTVASLQEYALAKGIDKSVRSMTQAEKSILRYNYIMEKSTHIQGDMARTLVTPANALRILSAQFTQLKRAAGNVVSVLVTQLIPYVQATVEIITDAANALAKFFGFKLPTIDYSGLDTGGYADDLEDGEDAINGTADTLKKIKKQLMGFDELNIISNPDTADSGASGGDAGGGALNMKPLEYDFLSGLDTSKADEIKEKLYKIFEVAKWIGIAIIGWNLGSFLSNLALAEGGIAALKAKLSTLATTAGITIGATIAVVGLAWMIETSIDIWKNGLGLPEFGELMASAGFTVAGASLLGGSLAKAMGKTFKSGLKMGAGVAALVSGVIMLTNGIKDLITSGPNLANILTILSGALTVLVGVCLLWNAAWLANPITWIIAGVMALIAAIALCIVYWDEIVAAIQVAWDWTVELFSGVAEWFNVNVIDPVAGFFSWLWEGISGGASACWDAIVEFFSPAVEWFSELFGSIFQTISDIFYNIGVIAKGCWEIIKIVWGVVAEWFNTWIIKPIANFFSWLWDGIKNAASNTWQGIKKIFSPLAEFFSGIWNGFLQGAKNAWEGVKSVFSTVGTFFKNIFTNAWQGIINVFSIAGDIFVDIKDGIVSAFKWVVNGIIKGINSVVAVPFNAINGVLSWLKNIEIAGIKPFGSVSTINIPQIPLLASGGIVDAGQMFIAREAGPELVGSIGNKTAVANNDQIIAGIEGGVYRAMMAANANNSGGNQTIRIINEIDGDVVGEKVIQYHNGKVIQTGVSPLLV